jgi:deoxyribodipyrimidine photo-lyase
MDPVAIVWLKRDLRLQDHEPLFEASKLGVPVLLLFCWEKSLLNCDHLETRHFDFVSQSILDMNTRLQSYGTHVMEYKGEVVDALEMIRTDYRIVELLSHEETGLRVTYNRDLEVKAYCKKRGIVWREFSQFGVQRGRMNREGWAKEWHNHMFEPQRKVELMQIRWFNEGKPLIEAGNEPLSLKSSKPHLQPGGSSYARRYLHTFLKDRHLGYSRGISKPLVSRRTCSRLSSYIAWGNLSMREVFQSSHETTEGYKAALRQFETRLRWHCHFIQKFEMEDRMEFEPINRGYKGWHLEPREDWQEAWEIGMTGFPLVDACMRCVTETGYLNFRMRAMLVSFLTHLLLQPWQRGAVFLGRQFLDFEPGIHYPQFQMQAGLTGINTIRIYNPIKQAEEHDPEALFIREWVPELAHVPLPYIFQPETMPREWRVKSGYPEPIINLSEAHRKARETLWALQKHPEVQLESRRILGRHTLPNRKT